MEPNDTNDTTNVPGTDETTAPVEETTETPAMGGEETTTEEATPAGDTSTETSTEGTM